MAIALFFTGLGQVFASHIRAGEITATRVQGRLLSYNFKLTVYTDIRSSATNPTATLYFGEIGPNGGELSQTVSRTNRANLPLKNTDVNEYNFTHTYQAPGAYTVYYWEVNRNTNVRNMTQSDMNSFYIETFLVIDPFLGLNNTPVLNLMPLDQGTLGQPFIHNPAAYDSDGDSLSFELLPCRQFETPGGATLCTGFQMPDVRAGGLNLAGTANATLSIDPTDGTMIWDVPRNIEGEYNVAFKVSEWRLDTNSNRRVLIGYVVRDMQILILDSRNKPPLLDVPPDTCVQAGNLLQFGISATDPDPTDLINLGMESGLDTVNPSALRPRLIALANQLTPASGVFRWQTACRFVREEPYNFVFRAEDVPAFPPPLVDLKSTMVRVIAPKPTGLVARSTQTGIQLTWDNYRQTVCPNADLIEVWRRIDSVPYTPDSCTRGMPGSLGFSKIATISARFTSYFDPAGVDTGVKRGPVYYYRIVAVFPYPGLGNSRPSDADSATLPLSVPIFTKASVLNTDTAVGIVRVEWAQPKELDPQNFPPPYRYILKRARVGSRNFVPVYTTQNLSDTFFTDSGLNTQRFAWQYRLVFQFNLDVRPESDSVDPVQTIWARTIPREFAIRVEWASARTPWTNTGTRHELFKKVDSNFYPLDTLNPAPSRPNVLDNGSLDGVPMLMGKRYRYYALAEGRFAHPKLKHIPIENLSQITIGSPLDTVIPCPPSGLPKITSVPCASCQDFKNPGSLFNTISFTQDVSDCDSDVVAYNLYYSRYEEDTSILVQRVEVGAGALEFRHSDNGSLAGCYFIRAEDASGNLSEPSNRICKDNCIFFELPNVFTPNRDGYNDYFEPSCFVPEFLDAYKIRIYDRWGQTLFEQDNIKDLRWDGSNWSAPDRGPADAGTYFFEAEVRFKTLKRGSQPKFFKGWVELIK